MTPTPYVFNLQMIDYPSESAIFVCMHQFPSGLQMVTKIYTSTPKVVQPRDEPALRQILAEANESVNIALGTNYNSCLMPEGNSI